jgi:hypothetical protein
VTVGPGDEMPACAGSRSHMRASHADREHVIGTLKAAYVYGLVTKDEFDARVSQTFASRTYAELGLVTADLPAGLAAAPPEPARVQGNAPAGANVRPGDRAIIATATFADLALATSLFTTNPVAGLLVIAAASSAFVSFFLIRSQILGSRRDKRSGGQLPAQRTISTGPGTGRRAVSAAPAGQLPHISKPRRQSSGDAARRHLPRPATI